MSKEKRQDDKTAHMHTYLHLVAALSIQTGRGDEAGAVVPGSGQKDEVARKGLVFLHKDHVPHLRRTHRQEADGRRSLQRQHVAHPVSAANAALPNELTCCRHKRFLAHRSCIRSAVFYILHNIH